MAEERYKKADFEDFKEESMVITIPLYILGRIAQYIIFHRMEH